MKKKTKRTRQQIINELFSNRQVQKLIRELQNLEKKFAASLDT